MEDSILDTVSVPLRGKYRGESVGEKLAPVFNLLRVSVPLRGKYRGESYSLVQSFAKYRSVFPSPCGVNIVANNILEQLANIRSNPKVSVPLRGKYRGESIGAPNVLPLTVVTRTAFPSPCGVNIVANAL